uniref:RNA polymerase sigma-70 domain-containing protein n=1 Tax=Nelumbo nucifera TaxID=4432 RepID=A0A822YB46_NELNU|nr:TPA_asm: hypothetical protein HUJ06_031125 [Nelumbo nucifera]
MATICSSSSNHSPSLPTVSLYSIPTKSSSVRTLQSLQYPPSFSSATPSSKPGGLGLASDDSLAVAAAAEAVALASAAAQAARDAASSALALTECQFGGNNMLAGNFDRVSDWADWTRVGGAARSRRKKRSKALELSAGVDLSNNCMESCSFRPSRSMYLTPKEEAEFSLYLKEEARLEAARTRLRETNEHEPTSSQWAEAAGMRGATLDKMLCQARESRERIVFSYRRLIFSIASGYQGKGLSLQDLIQEGSIGLLRGVERFDPRKGYKLSTYVYWWIKQAIIRAIASKSRMVRLPGSVSEMMAKIAEANTVLSTRLGRVPTYDEIADMLGICVSTVSLLCERSRPPMSVDRTYSDHGCMKLQEIISGPEETTPETMVNRQLMKQEVERLLKILGEREANILRLYFGLNGETPCSFEEIGRLLNLSRERVRQIYYIALAKLQQSNTIDDLRLYFL